MPPTTTKRKRTSSLPLDGYVRVSKVGARTPEEGFISPEVQEQAIRDWAKGQGFQVVMQQPELNVSGGTMNRPIFNQLMERVRSGQSGGIVVYKSDRFARSLLGAVSTLAELGEHNAAFASVTEQQLEYVTPQGRAFMHMLFTFAEFVRDTLKEDWATGNRFKIEQGIQISPTGYLGYDRGSDKKLVPNKWAPVAREVYLRRPRGASWAELADFLNEQGAPKPQRRNAATATIWTPESVQRLCEKHVYKGWTYRYLDQDIEDRGAVINRQAHVALVTEAEWEAAQMTPLLTKREGKPLPLLSEKLRCQACRYSMSRGKDRYGHPVYRCRRKHASGTCPNPASVMAEPIERYVEEMTLLEVEGLVKFVPDSAERDDLSEQLQLARESTEDFKRDTAARRKLGADWHSWLDEYLRVERELAARLADIDQHIGVVQQGLTREHYLALPLAERREVLAGFIDCVFVRRSRGRGRHVDPIDLRTRILWRGQAPADLPVRRVASPLVPFDFDDNVEAGTAAA